MLDRRFYKRCNLHGKGTIKNFKSEDTHFELVNISASGALISSKEDIDKNQLVDINIRFSGHIVESILSCKALVLWKEHLNNRILFGVKFMLLDDKERIEIDELIVFSCNTGNVVIGMDSCDEGHCKIWI